MLYSNRYIIIDKIINRILTKKNVSWSKMSPSKIAHKLLGKSKCFHPRLRELLINSLGDVSKINLNDISADEKNTILFYANETLGHKFNYLGSGWTEIDPIDWHTDFISGHTWIPGSFYRNYLDINPEGGYDIKIVWELSRCHHLLWLAEAYSITKDRKYSKKVITQISDWIHSNPLMYSINWTCSMDVAIRAVNWMYAIGIIIDSGDVDDEVSNMIYESLYEHGFFIINNLEKTIPYSGNHYLSNLIGLLFIGSLFPNNFFARKWFQFAFKEFQRETLIEISADGTNYEHSISYHRLVSELFIYTYAMLKRLKYPLSHEIEFRFKSMIDYIASYTKRSGLSPLIGDNDNGRLLPFTPRDFRKHSYMCTIGNALWGNRYDDYKDVSSESLYISCGLADVLNSGNSFIVKDSSLYPDNKLAIVRDNETELFVTNSPFSINRCLDVGMSGGTHTHPDALSFDLSFDGEDYILDPGTYVYTSNPSLRNELRATINHNTIALDSLNQTKFLDRNVFLQSNYTIDHTINIVEKNNMKIITGSYAFNNDRFSFNHFRSFEVEGGRVIIKDILNCVGAHDLFLNFHISPDIRIDNDSHGVLLQAVKGFAEITVSENNKVIIPKIVDSLFSPSYGILQDSKSLRYRIKISNKSEITTEIQWKKKSK